MPSVDEASSLDCNKV